MNPSPRYSNSHSEQLDRINREAIEYTTKAAQFGERLNEAKADRTAAKKIFFDELTDESATALADAQRRFSELTVINAAIEEGGGLEAVRTRYLRADAVFDVFSKGFAEKIAALEKLIPAARKRYSERIAAFVETGQNIVLAQRDERATLLRVHLLSIEAELAVAVFGKTYADDKGDTREHKTWESLYEELTRPLPSPPLEPV